MKEAVFILIVILLLLALTALRYRKQINMLISVSRTLREAQATARSKRVTRKEEVVSKGELVSCAKCGTWSPKGKSIKFAGGIYYCSQGCLNRAAV